DPLANTDDGSCCFVSGCTDSLAINYDPLACYDNATCISPILGCLDSTAMNYNSAANTDNGTCVFLTDRVDLFISEYAEGSSSNKYIEIYNPTSNPVDLSDYALTRVSNAPTTPGVYEYWVDFDSGSVILPGDVYVVAPPSADSLILLQTDMTYSALSNGDDGFALVYGAQPSNPIPPGNEYIILDFLGDFNGDPGVGWDVAGVTEATKDHTLVRKCDVLQGNTDWILSAGTTAQDSEWEVLSQDDWSDLGQHTSPCQALDIYGCMDSLALNYNSSATINDGSCIYPVYGCTNSSAVNYDSLANTDDGSCCFVSGCTDSLAINYDPLACNDDGTCIAPILGCIDVTAMNYDAAANTDDGTCVFLSDKVGLYISEYAEGSSSNKYIEIYNPTSNPVDLSDYALTRVSNAPTTPGVYEYWVNFDSGAVILPGDVYVVAPLSADSLILLQTDMTYSALSNGDDGFALVYGVKPLNPTLPGNEYVILDFLGDFNGDPGAGWDVAGVTEATKDHTLVRKCNIGQGNTDWILSAGTTAQDSEWEVHPKDDWSALGQHITPCQSVYVYGCMDSLALNYNVLANITDGSCIYAVYGCTNSSALNYDSLANTDDGSCCFVSGCTDSLAINYDPLACNEDSSCIAPILGCIDATAMNYDAGANTDDGTCVFLSDKVGLYISEYAEGSSSNKYIEIYNPTSNPVDLSDYALARVNNAPTTPGVYEYWVNFDSAAVILPGDVYVVAPPSADSLILVQTDMTYSVLSNGDDGFALVYGAEPSNPILPGNEYIILDFLGDFNGDPGAGWDVAGVTEATKDHTLVRKCDVVQGNTDWILSAGTTAQDSEWEVLSQDDWSDLGQHTSPCQVVDIYGCMDSLALNYNASATINDGSCIYAVYGCTNSSAVNYDPLANTDDGSCCFVSGCTDSLAINYDPVACNDDGTCIAPILGCIDATAMNYDAGANTDDGTCVFLSDKVDLFISEYAEGSSSNKYLEIYNPSANPVDLSDYALARVSNAPTTPGVYEYWVDFDPGAVILPGDVYVVAPPSADSLILLHTDMT
ncbi:MAG: lamin tail domain-containing protein, partial [Saprospiraceae bacterium]|nr:lamin tail domain-containing protein [Saprospiraceae bacterium]